MGSSQVQSAISGNSSPFFQVEDQFGHVKEMEISVFSEDDGLSFLQDLSPEDREDALTQIIAGFDFDEQTLDRLSKMNYDQQISFLDEYTSYEDYLSTREKVLKIPSSQVDNFKKFLKDNGYSVPEMFLSE